MNAIHQNSLIMAHCVRGEMVGENARGSERVKEGKDIVSSDISSLTVTIV